MNLLKHLLLLALVSLLAACGASSSPPPASDSPRADDSGIVTEPELPLPPPAPPMAWRKLWNMCAVPRPGLDPHNLPYYDLQGTLDDEMNWLRSWIDFTYLWYKDVPSDLNYYKYSDPHAWFDALKSPQLTASGKPKDQFHFTYPSDKWDALNSSGIALGYGVTWSRGTSTSLPRFWLASMVEPGSPAASAGLRRGDQLAVIDGVDFLHAASAELVAKINAGLTPAAAGEVHQFGVLRDGVAFSVSLEAAAVASTPVQNVKLIDTPTGKVGYLTFNSHNGASERQLIDAITELKDAGVADLVLDLRYNGGGLLYVASELAYMIAGPGPTTGKVFERPTYNDKMTPGAPIPFRSTAYGYSAPKPAKSGQALPTLGLRHVTVLSTPGTCSASESVINSLRGVDVDVTLIGGRTCGKPYAFTPTQNCGTTYFAIQLQGVNDKGFGDYADGFAPTCSAADDFGHAQGDPVETMLAAALAYRASGSCPSGSRAKSLPLQVVREQVHEIAIYPPNPSLELQR